MDRTILKDNIQNLANDKILMSSDELAGRMLKLFDFHVSLLKQKMAFCTDDKDFLEVHGHANVIEYDKKLNRPSKAIYLNRQWQAEREGLGTLVAFGASVEEQS